MATQTKQHKPEPRIIELPHHSYQPSVAELHEDTRVDASSEELAKAALEPVKIAVSCLGSVSPRCWGFATYCM